MARQDIYGTIGDDILGTTGHTSSMRGIIKRVDVWINTDVAGKSSLEFLFDKDKKNVIVRGSMPSQWVWDVSKLEKVI